MPRSDRRIQISLSARDVNPIEPVRNRRFADGSDRPAAAWPSSRNAASFGRGVRWPLFSSREIDWYVAMSLPLGLMASLLLLLMPLFIPSGSHSSGFSPDVILVGVWVIGLLVQCSVALACLAARRKTVSGQANPNALVTLTIGGVWATSASAVWVDDDDGIGAPLAANPRVTSLRIVVMWLLILTTLAALSLTCLIADSVSSINVDRPWVAAAWIFGLQLIWQLLPLPQSLGRIGWSIVIGWLTPTEPLLEGQLTPDANSIRRDDDSSDFLADAVLATRRVRWWVIGFAFLCLTMGVLAIQAAGFSSEPGGQPFPIFAGVVLLTLWLFASSRSEDVFATQLTLAENGETGRLHGKVGIRAQWRSWQQRRDERTNTQRLKAAVAREQSEASDASRVDGILQRMHESGVESLTTEERDLLKRVSEAIRRQRDRDGDGDGDRDGRE